MDRYAELGCAAAAAALAGAPDIRPGRGDGTWGVILGSSLGCWASNREYLFDLEHRRPAMLSPALFVRTVASSAIGEICIAHGIGGVNETVVSGWPAGAEAVAEACALLAERRVRFVLAGGIESPDEVLRRQHRDRRRSEDLEWLPELLEEAAALCLLTTAEEENPTGRLRIVAYGRGHDPRGEWSLSTALQRLEWPTIESVIVTDPVPPQILGRWQEEAGGRRLLRFAGGSRAFGAAGAPLALACAGRWLDESSPDGGILLVARGIEGGIAALVVSS